MRRLGYVAGGVALVALLFTLDRGIALVTAPTYERATLQTGADFWGERTVATVGPDERSVPAQLPGPADGWAGGEPKTIALTIPPPADRGRGWLLKIGILDSHDTAPPVIEIVAGSMPPTVIAIRPGHGATHWLTDGLRSHIELSIPHDALVEGELPVTIRSLSGSWIALQRVELIADVPSWEYDAAVALWLLLAVGYAVVATRYRLWRQHADALAGRWNRAIHAVASRISTPGRAALFVFVVMQIFFGIQREWIVPYDADFERRYYYMVGDEPEYFLGAWSLAYDGDMNIRNDVIEGSWKNFWNQQIWDFYFGSLAHFKTMAPAMADVPEEAWEGVQLMVHRPGMSALIFPAAYNVDQFRWTSYVITTTVAALALAALVWLAGGLGIPTAGATLIALLFVATPPLFFYVNQLFPESTVGLGLALITMLLIDARRGSLIVAALMVIALPWFSDRGLIASALLGIGSLFIARDGKTRALLFTLYAVGAVALAQYYLYRFGVPWPMYHNPYGPASMTYIPFNLSALLIDGSKGLFVLAPMMLGVGAAYVAWFRSRLYRTVFWLNVAAQLVTIVTTTSNLDWWGGGCPAGRYTVLMIWMSLPAWVFWIKTGVTRTQRWMLAPLFLFGLVESASLFTKLPWWHARFNPLFHYEWTAPVDGILPDFMPGGDPLPLALVWGALFTAMMVAIVMAGRRKG